MGGMAYSDCSIFLGVWSGMDTQNVPFYEDAWVEWYILFLWVYRGGMDTRNVPFL